MVELLPIGPFVDVASWIDGDDLDGGRMHRKAERRIAGLSDRAVIHERSSRGESPEPVRTTGHGISKIVAPIPHDRKRTTSRRLSGVQGSHLVVASVYRDADIPPARRNVDASDRHRRRGQRCRRRCYWVIAARLHVWRFTPATHQHGKEGEPGTREFRSPHPIRFHDPCLPCEPR